MDSITNIAGFIGTYSTESLTFSKCLTWLSGNYAAVLDIETINAHFWEQINRPTKANNTLVK